MHTKVLKPLSTKTQGELTAHTCLQVFILPLLQTGAFPGPPHWGNKLLIRQGLKPTNAASIEHPLFLFALNYIKVAIHIPLEDSRWTSNFHMLTCINICCFKKTKYKNLSQKHSFMFTWSRFKGLRLEVFFKPNGIPVK